MIPPWWQRAVFYHIYVRSFQDSNDDGIGDLPGLLSRIDTITALGVDAVWLSPCYPSPQADFGYDVADYRGVDPAYGTLEDLARLRDALHDHGMRLLLDFVPNHTSNQHAWFRDALTGRDARYRDWYIWKDPAPDGGPPNNWMSIFGGPAWRFHESTGQYYLHSFLPEQPDLNWRNPEVVAEMEDTLRFWLDWGIDGFRVDAIHQVAKDPAFRDNPPDPDYPLRPDAPGYDPFRAQLHRYDTMQSDAFEMVEKLRTVVNEYDDRVLVGETPVDTWNEYVAFLGDGTDRFHLAFDFHQLKARSMPTIARSFEELYAHLPATAWPTLVLSNHDVDRHVTRLGAEQTGNDALARQAAAALLLARGSPFVYFGEEIGLPNSIIADDALLDPVGLWERQRGHRIFFSQGYASLGRDPERTPMPWTDEQHGGFSRAAPWLPMPDPARRNVAAQRSDPDSVWNWYRRLIELRKRHRALQTGSYHHLGTPTGVWAFERRANGERIAVVIVHADDGEFASPCGGQVLEGTHRPSGSVVRPRAPLQCGEVVIVRS